jgi:membrane associated rhomboid family serine protease
MSRNEKRAKAIANLKVELFKIVKGTLEFKRTFLVYFAVLLTCVIVFGISQVYPNIENTLSASRATPWGIITSIFVHTNFWHLALNMGSLFAFMFLFAFCNSTFALKTKRRIEDFFLVSVFVFAVISNILWIAFTSNGSIGASGLVYAVEGVLIGFSLVSGLQLLNFSRFKAQNISTKYVVFINIRP